MDYSNDELDKMLKAASDVVLSRKLLVYKDTVDYSVDQIRRLLERARAINVLDDTWLPGVHLYLSMKYATEAMEDGSRLPLRRDRIAAVMKLANLLGFDESLCRKGIVDLDEKDEAFKRQRQI